MLLPHSTDNLRCISDEGGQGYSGKYKSDCDLAPCELRIYVHNSEVKVFEGVIAYFNSEIIVGVVQLRYKGDLKPGTNAFLAVATAFNIYTSGRQALP